MSDLKAKTILLCAVTAAAISLSVLTMSVVRCEQVAHVDAFPQQNTGLKHARKEILNGHVELAKEELLRLASSCRSDDTRSRKLELECWQSLSDIADNERDATDYSTKALQVCRSIYGDDGAQCVPILERQFRLHSQNQQSITSRQLLKKVIDIKRRTLGSSLPDERLIEMELSYMQSDLQFAHSEAGRQRLAKLLHEIALVPSIISNKAISSAILGLIPDQGERDRLAKTFMPLTGRRKATEYNFTQSLRLLIAWHSFHERLNPQAGLESNYFTSEIRSFLNTKVVSDPEKCRRLLAQIEETFRLGSASASTEDLLINEYCRLERAPKPATLAHLLTTTTGLFPGADIGSSAWQQLRACVDAAPKPDISMVLTLVRATHCSPARWQQLKPALAKLASRSVDPSGENLRNLGEICLYASENAASSTRQLLEKFIDSLSGMYRADHRCRIDVASYAAGTLARFNVGRSPRGRRICARVLNYVRQLVNSPEPPIGALADLINVAKMQLISETELNHLIEEILRNHIKNTPLMAGQLSALCIHTSANDSPLTLSAVRKTARLIGHYPSQIPQEKNALFDQFYDAGIYAAQQEARNENSSDARLILQELLNCLGDVHQSTDLRTCRTAFQMYVLTLAEPQAQKGTPEKWLNTMQNILSTSGRLADYTHLYAGRDDAHNFVCADKTDQVVAALEKTAEQTTESRELRAYLFWNAARLAVLYKQDGRARRLLNTASQACSDIESMSLLQDDADKLLKLYTTAKQSTNDEVPNKRSPVAR